MTRYFIFLFLVPFCLHGPGGGALLAGTAAEPLPGELRNADFLLQDPPDGEPLTGELFTRIRNDAFSLTALIMSVGRYSFDDDRFNGGRSFSIDNARLGIRGNIDPDFTYRLQFRLDRTPSLLDAWLQYRLHDLFQIRAGAQKPDISAELFHAAGTTEFIRRARLTGTQLNSREIGVSLLGNSGGWWYSAGIFNGNGVRSNLDNRFFTTFRTWYEHRPDEDRFLQAGLNFAAGDCFDASCSPSGMNVQGRRVSAGADARVERGPWLFSGEILVTRADVVHPLYGEERLAGSHLTAGRLAGERTRLLIRWDHLSYREAELSSDRLLFGVNHEISSLLRFQFNLLTEFEEGETRGGVSANLQLRF